MYSLPDSVSVIQQCYLCLYTEQVVEHKRIFIVTAMVVAEAVTAVIILVATLDGKSNINCRVSIIFYE